MFETLTEFFSIERFMPHGHCFLWRPGLLWSLVISDSIIGISYYSIPLALLVAVKRRKKDSLNWIFLMFSAFIFACGTTHFIDIATIWYPNYWLDAGAKIVTAIISVATAIALWPIVNRATEYVTEQEKNTKQLQNTNVHLNKVLDTLEQRQADFNQLNKMSGYLHACNSTDEIGSTIADTIYRLWPHSSGCLYIISPDENVFEISTTWGPYKTDKSINPGDCWAYRLGGPFPDPETGSSLACNICGRNIKSDQSCIPVTGGGKTLGLLHVTEIDYFAEDRARNILPLLVQRLGLAIYNLRLQQYLEFKSTRDSLTGLYNRRYLEESLKVEENRARRTGGTFSIVMFDLDHFKDLNDSYGHDAGDQALQLFARIIKSSLRSGDIACRYGGEEFVLILPDTDLVAAEETATRIRRNLETGTNSGEIHAFKDLTVSAGIAIFPLHGQSGMDVLRKADKALYESKNAGRNTVRSVEI